MSDAAPADHGLLTLLPALRAGVRPGDRVQTAGLLRCMIVSLSVVVSAPGTARVGTAFAVSSVSCITFSGTDVNFSFPIRDLTSVGSRLLTCVRPCKRVQSRGGDRCRRVRWDGRGAGTPASSMWRRSRASRRLPCHVRCAAGEASRPPPASACSTPPASCPTAPRRTRRGWRRGARPPSASSRRSSGGGISPTRSRAPPTRSPMRATTCCSTTSPTWRPATGSSSACRSPAASTPCSR